MGLKSLAKLFSFVLCNPCQSLFLCGFFIISLKFFHLCKALISGFLQFKRKFVDDHDDILQNIVTESL